MTAKSRVVPTVGVASSRFGMRWRLARGITQSLAVLAVVVAPLLGGWQRLDRNYLGAWNGHGWDLPDAWLARLPLGDAPRMAYESTGLAGGGSGVDYFGIGFSDPVAGFVSIAFGGQVSVATVLAWAMTVTLGLLAGRVFCGWFCPFGSLARGLEALMARSPVQWPRLEPPRTRALRYVLLAAVVVLGGFGLHCLLYFSLPHVLVQQSVYAMWLMGGGGAALGALLGLVFACMAFGPTNYCAVLCPTGAALALAGRVRRVHLRIADVARCGHACELCSRACWLALDPAAGDPGPDCDLCARCSQVCPHDNLEIGVVRPVHRGDRHGHRGVPSAMAGLVALLMLAGAACGTAPDRARETIKPRLLLESHTTVNAVDYALAVIDMQGIELDANDGVTQQGTELSLYVARGPVGALDPRGAMAPRAEIYTGPLTISLRAPGQPAYARLEFSGPNQPVSTPHRSVYRRRIADRPLAGHEIVLAELPGWSEGARVWRIPRENTGSDPEQMFVAGLAAAFLFGGAMAWALGVRSG